MKIASKFIIFCFVGGTSFLIDILFFNLFFYFDMGFFLSRIFSIGIAIIYNFSINRNFTFSAKRQSIKKNILRYSIIYLISNGINLLTGVILISFLGNGTLQANIAAITGIIVAIPISFLGSLFWVFKK